MTRHTRLLALAATLGLLLCAPAGAAEAGRGDPSLYDKARSGTTRAAKATGSALDRAAERTGEFMKQVPKKIGVAAKKTDAALNRAADKVGLPRDGKGDAAHGRQASPGLKAGPRPTP